MRWSALKPSTFVPVSVETSLRIWRRLELEAWMRRPLASQTTEAGLGWSLTGQAGMGGGGGGVCATGTGCCFFKCRCDRGWRPGWDCDVVGVAWGWDGDCTALAAPQRTGPAKNTPASTMRGNREEEAMRDCRQANVRMEIIPLRLRRPFSCGSDLDVFAPPHCIRLSVAEERSWSF